MKAFLICILTCCFLFSCKPSKNETLIVGEWQGSQWLVNAQESANNAKGTSFIFKTNSEYSFDYAGVVEKGNFKVVDDKLYTTPYHQQEIMVKISTLNLDSLVFDMNRGGQSETLILLRKK